MAKSKKVEEILNPQTEPQVVEESEAKKEFRKLIEAYKIQNPVKYAQKEPELIRKLNSL